MGTVEKNLKNGLYSSPLQFGADIRKIWSNSFLYNQRGSDIYQMTMEMESYFESLFKASENPVMAINSNSSINELQKKVEKLSRELKELNKTPKTSGVTTKKPKSRNSKMETAMSMQEKRVLVHNIRNLPREHLRGVWEIVSEGVPPNQQQKDEIEFDIDTLSVRKTRELEK